MESPLINMEQSCFGNIVVIRKNGKEGGQMEITGDLVIGRQVGCEILIKLPEVSRQHAKICIEKTGQVTLHNLSRNGLTVNGSTTINDCVTLNHHDQFAIGPRLFRYDAPMGLKEPEKNSATYGKQLKANDEADVTMFYRGNENMNISNASKPPQSLVFKKPTPKKPNATPLASKEMKKTLPTPIRRAIQSKPQMSRVHSKKTEDKDIDRSLPTPLKQEIRASVMKSNYYYDNGEEEEEYTNMEAEGEDGYFHDADGNLCYYDANDDQIYDLYDNEEEEEEEEESAMASFDPMSLPTPVRPAGKRVVFDTPEAAEDRVWENYNSRWRYEDYDHATTTTTTNTAEEEEGTVENNDEAAVNEEDGNEILVDEDGNEYMEVYEGDDGNYYYDEGVEGYYEEEGGEGYYEEGAEEEAYEHYEEEAYEEFGVEEEYMYEDEEGHQHVVTPFKTQGKHVVFDTPEAEDEREWEQYNARWTYEDTSNTHINAHDSADSSSSGMEEEEEEYEVVEAGDDDDDDASEEEEYADSYSAVSNNGKRSFILTPFRHATSDDEKVATSASSTGSDQRIRKYNGTPHPSSGGRRRNIRTPLKSEIMNEANAQLYANYDEDISMKTPSRHEMTFDVPMGNVVSFGAQAKKMKTPVRQTEVFVIPEPVPATKQLKSLKTPLKRQIVAEAMQLTRNRELASKRTLKTPLKREIVSAASSRPQKYVRKPIKTPLKKQLIAAALARPERQPAKTMKTPLKKQLIAVARARPEQQPAKSMEFSLKKQLVAAARARPERQPAKTMKTPLKKQLIAVARARPEQQPVKTMKTPLKKQLIAVARARPERQPVKTMKTPLKKQLIAVARARPEQQPAKTMKTPLKKQLIAVARARPERQSAKTMKTPLKKQLIAVARARHVPETMKSMSTPLRKDIKVGKQLRRVRPTNCLATPLKAEIAAVALLPERSMDSAMKRELVTAAEELLEKMKLKSIPVVEDAEVFVDSDAGVDTEDEAVVPEDVVMSEEMIPEAEEEEAVVEEEDEEAEEEAVVEEDVSAEPMITTDQEEVEIKVANSDVYEGDKVDTEMKVEESEDVMEVEESEDMIVAAKNVEVEVSPSENVSESSSLVSSDEELPCAVCATTEVTGGNIFLLCDKCDSAVHLYCAGLKHVPRGDWFCNECKPKTVTRKRKPSIAALTPSRKSRRLSIVSTPLSTPLPASVVKKTKTPARKSTVKKAALSRDTSKFSKNSSLEDLMSCRVIELRAALKERGMSGTGIKTVLAGRLLEALENEN